MSASGESAEDQSVPVEVHPSDDAAQPSADAHETSSEAPSPSDVPETETLETSDPPELPLVAPPEVEGPIAPEVAAPVPPEVAQSAPTAVVVSPNGPAKVEPDARRSPRHWPLLVLVFVLLAGAAMLVVASALPAVARELGWTHARTVSRMTHRTANASRAGIDAVKEREQKLVLEGQEDDDDAPLGGGTQVGISAQQTTLFRGPATTTATVGSVDRGERLVVVREDHGFFLVIHHGPNGTDIGWVRKADVLVR